jgi:RimJ/RimL family protein N-acetyltransferase
MEDFMYLQKDNLTIRNATTNDSELLAKWWNDGKVMAHAGFPNGINTTPEKVAQLLSTDDDNIHRRLIIEVNSLPVGEMNFRRKDKETAEIGIKICDFEKQEKGHGTKLLKMLISSLFHDLGYGRIILDTNLKNTRAQHVYEKIGFNKKRVHINSWKDQLGNLQSFIDYELYKKDYVE